MIVATPLFGALKKQGGIGYLAVVCSRQNEMVIRHNPHVDCRKTVSFNSAADVLRLVGWIRRQRFDALIDLTPGFSRTNVLITQLSGSRGLRVGVNKERIAPLFHMTIEERDTPLAARILRLGSAVTKTGFSGEPRYEIYSGEADVRRAQEFLSGRAVRTPFLAINLSAGVTHRQWGLEKYRALLALLFKDRTENGRVLLISYGSQLEWAQRLAAEFTGCIAMPQLPFLTTVEIIGKAGLLVSPDTSLVHAAAARGIPVVGMYTADPENFARWRPWGTACKTVQSSVPGSIESIGPDQVYAAVLELAKGIDSIAFLLEGKRV
jgi:ADP-heptose:LPS heptosyltransferase